MKRGGLRCPIVLRHHWVAGIVTYAKGGAIVALDVRDSAPSPVIHDGRRRALHKHCPQVEIIHLRNAKQKQGSNNDGVFVSAAFGACELGIRPRDPMRHLRTPAAIYSSSSAAASWVASALRTTTIRVDGQHANKTIAVTPSIRMQGNPSAHRSQKHGNEAMSVECQRRVRTTWSSPSIVYTETTGTDSFIRNPHTPYIW